MSKESTTSTSMSTSSTTTKTSTTQARDEKRRLVVYSVTSLVNFSEDDVDPDNVRSKAFTDKASANQYLIKFATRLYYAYMTYKDEPSDTNNDGEDYDDEEEEYKDKSHIQKTIGKDQFEFGDDHEEEFYWRNTFGFVKMEKVILDENVDSEDNVVLYQKDIRHYRSL
jgi:hypothetical protein